MSEASPGEPSPAEHAPSSNQSGRRNRRGGRNNRNSVTRADRFTGKTNALAGHIYQIGSAFDQGETFQKTTREIAEYLGRLFDDDELRTAVLELKMAPLIRPQAPKDAADNRVAFELWKSDLADYKKKLEDRKKHGARAYAIIYGQCSSAVRKIIESHDSWEDVNKGDFIGLLKLIQQAMITKNTRKHPTHSLIDAENAFNQFRQGPNMSDSDYLDRFTDLVEVVLHAGGELGGSKKRVDEYIRNQYGKDPELIATEAYEAAVEECRDEYLAVSLLTKADRAR